MTVPYPVDVNPTLERGETSLLLDDVTEVDDVEILINKDKDLLIVTSDQGVSVSPIIREAARLAHGIAQKTELPRPDLFLWEDAA